MAASWKGNSSEPSVRADAAIANKGFAPLKVIHDGLRVAQCITGTARLTTCKSLSSMNLRFAGGFCDQAGYRQRHRNQDEYNPDQGGAGGGNGFRSHEERSRTRAAHRTAALRCIQCEAAQDGNWAKPTYRATSEHPAWEGSAVQAGQGTSGASGATRRPEHRAARSTLARLSQGIIHSNPACRCIQSP